MKGARARSPTLDYVERRPAPLWGLRITLSMRREERNHARFRDRIVGLSSSLVRTAHRALGCSTLVLLVSTQGAREAGAREREVTAEARQAARTLVVEASSAFEAGDFERALALFDRAAEVVEAPTVALMQARTLVELGRLVAAVERYDAAQRTDAAGGGNAAFRDAAQQAASELEALRLRVPTLRIKLGGAPAKDARLSLDGMALDSEEATQEKLVDPGTHRVEVTTSDGTSASRTVTLVEGAREELVFSLEPAVRVPAAAPPAPAPPPERQAPASRVAGWATLGAGVAFTGGAAALGVLALGHKRDLDAACQGGCPAEYGDDLDAFRTERALSYVGFALGAAGIGAGTYLLLKHEPDGTATALAISPNGIHLSGRFQ